MSRNFYTIFSKNFKKIFNDYKRNDSNLDDLIRRLKNDTSDLETDQNCAKLCGKAFIG